MSQDKNDKPQGGSAVPGGKPAVDKAAEATKRPYATLDLTATEVAAGKIAVPPAGTPAEKPAEAAKPAATGSIGGARAEAGSAGAANPKMGGTATPPSQAGAAGKAAPSTKPSPSLSKAGLTAWVPSLVSGAAGAILTLLGLGAAGLIGGDPQAGALDARLAALEKQATAQPTGEMAGKVAAADKRLGAIETATRAMSETQAALAADAKALEARLAGQLPAASESADRIQKLERQLNDLAAAAVNDPQRGRIPALAQITTRLGELDTQIATRASSLKAELGQELEKRLATSAETTELARARLAQRTQSLEQTMKSVSDDTTALRTTVDGLKGDLDARFKATAKPADVSAAVEPVTSKLAGLEKNIATIVRSEQDRNATAGNILLSIELGNLKRAIDRGGRYATELAAVKKVGGDKLNLAVLESAQSTGVASITGLTSEFRNLAYAMLDAEADPDQGSVVDRLLASAKSVIRVRKVAHKPDDKSTEATIGRMEDSLKEGRLEDVLEQAKQLPSKPLAVAAPWLKKIEARYAIETAVANLEQSLKNALAGAADVKKGAN